MSSAGPTGAAVTAQLYLCHQCNRTVSISPSPAGDDLACPFCNGGFVEELEQPNPNCNNPSPAGGAHAFSFQAIDPFAAGAATGLPFFFSAAASSPAPFDLRNTSDLSGFFGSESSGFRSSATAAGPEPFNPLLFLQNYIQTLMSGGANIQVVLEGPGGPIGGNLGDYFIGPGLEQLIQQLAENDPNRYGTPPASKSAIEALPTITITENLLSHDEAQCAVCKDSFEMGAEAIQMPCKHVYHKDCILPWLELHNSCPVCRYELPTDDPDYEQRVRGEALDGQGLQSGGTSSASLGSGSSAPNSPGTRTMERRFRISLPWLFRAFSSQSDGSSGEGRGGNSGGHGGSGTESRQEDLG